jgi:hypothetical protein
MKAYEKLLIDWKRWKNGRLEYWLFCLPYSSKYLKNHSNPGKTKLILEMQGNQYGNRKKNT